MSLLLKRFLNFSAIGVPSVGFELLITFMCLEYFATTKFMAIAIAFGIAFSLSYFLMRHFAFFGTKRKLGRGYIYFLGIALVGGFLVSFSSVFISYIFNISIFMARPIVGCISGLLNFTINGVFNFKVL